MFYVFTTITLLLPPSILFRNEDQDLVEATLAQYHWGQVSSGGAPNSSELGKLGHVPRLFAMEYQSPSFPSRYLRSTRMLAF